MIFWATHLSFRTGPASAIPFCQKPVFKFVIVPLAPSRAPTSSWQRMGPECMMSLLLLCLIASVS